jgi:hypothetical protein
MDDRQHFDRIMAQSIDNAVRPLEDLPDLRRRRFRYCTPRGGKDKHLLQSTGNTLASCSA